MIDRAHDPVAVDLDLAASFLVTVERYARSNPAAALDTLGYLRQTVARLEAQTVAEARFQGFTWAQIAELLWVPRWLAWAHYRRGVPR